MPRTSKVGGARRHSTDRPKRPIKPRRSAPRFQDYYEALSSSESASDDPVYVISIAAELVGAHAQTLRHYERLGLVVPARSDGNIRLYSERDVARLAAIVCLTCELGLNLAGVSAILSLRRRIAELQSEVETLESELHRQQGYRTATGRPA